MKLMPEQYEAIKKAMRESGVHGAASKRVWEVAREEGFESALKVIERNAPDKDDLLTDGFSFPIWGEEFIDPKSVDQLRAATRISRSVGAALMPDAHVGYGLPIGGVLVMNDAVMPYGIGVDIGCSVHLSIYSESDQYISRYESSITQALIDNTRWGLGCNWDDRPAEHSILDDPRWNETPLLRSLKDQARSQLGTSGGGNHFVEIGHLYDHFNSAALLSHSGSRGIGAKICAHYTGIAKAAHPELKGEMANLAWLDMQGAYGQEYWLSMQLAGDFATACHDVIHERVSKTIGFEPIDHIGSTHNLAWNYGENFYVHRKGATPASAYSRGIIPATMVDGAFIVEGKGNIDSIESASHGAGRRMGRKEAMRTLSAADMDQKLSQGGITLIGGSLDESPEAYKDPFEVMDSQDDLVRVVGRFIPKIVVMADDGFSED